MSDDRVLIRAFALERAEPTGDGRTLVMRAVPYEYEIRSAQGLKPGEREVFSRGAFDTQIRTTSAPGRIKLTLAHPRPDQRLTDSLVGVLTSMEDRADGLYVEGRMATSSVANDTLALVNDGVLDQVSVGFVPLNTRREQGDGYSILRRVRAHMDHLALLPAGAYGDQAKVLAVREEADGEEPLGPTLADLRRLQARLR